MTDYIFIPTPISVKPDTDGEYMALTAPEEKYSVRLYWNKKWLGRTKPTHYLRKVPRKEWERERMIGFVEWLRDNAYFHDTKEGQRWFLHCGPNNDGDGHTTADLLQTYLQSL